jgi:hypothetical protein
MRSSPSSALIHLYLDVWLWGSAADVQLAFLYNWMHSHAYDEVSLPSTWASRFLSPSTVSSSGRASRSASSWTGGEEDHRWAEKECRWGRRRRTGMEEDHRRGRMRSTGG